MPRGVAYNIDPPGDRGVRGRPLFKFWASTDSLTNTVPPGVVGRSVPPAVVGRGTPLTLVAGRAR